ncbi:hypothetical protein [Alkalicoccobacillus murimartini]|uniref:Uncharacterized protein n=1 Tax=Alkalicoccobacillus murimartini TaxID=171685 RepID=A0ABT9YNK6_9BACI|nr:hypothetical protein [Alkalicoccobacillus murimartini]MDQ0209071.1 hypothetical protein [Alkalicoccobacillus murimartini]
MDVDGSTDIRSAVPNGIERVDTSFEDDIATVQFTIDEEFYSEENHIVFERGMQLLALDFKADELHLVNETEKVRSVFPLLGEG